ncbi:MAG: DUF3536 domain-containing protein [Candidatus Thermoplasmatota archaeon]
MEKIELQDSAYPYHDWNQRINAECYAPNAASRILDSNKEIIEIINNYSKISYNFGPTLLSWMEKNDSETYNKILDADQKSMEHFSGHGSAIAQCYNHMIMPLANRRDKRTQIIWGIEDFKHRFGRKPEGMWLPETAVDLESLGIMAEQGIKFTILAPHQAKKFREIGDEKWVEVENGSDFDTRQPYLCRLPSGREITIFFYNASVSKEVAFEELLDSGEDFAKRILSIFSNSEKPELVHIANDGETYGHHHVHGDMALSYSLFYIESNELAELTVYGEYLEKHPPRREVKLVENSSWSCIHGVERWKSDCGCTAGGHPGWNQKWRKPLRRAMDWVRDELLSIYREIMSDYVDDIWSMRDRYIEVVIDRNSENIENFFDKYFQKFLSKEDKIKVLKLLEMQRNAMLMYTSCGWFFDEPSRIETVQIMKYASRAIQLAEELSDRSIEPSYKKKLKDIESNKDYRDGSRIYDLFVKPAQLDFERVGAHYAISSLFNNHSESFSLYCYDIENKFFDRLTNEDNILVMGRVKIRSKITWDKEIISFAVVHLGNHNIIGGAENIEQTRFKQELVGKLKDAFNRADVSKCVDIIDDFFKERITLWHLFRDEQREILEDILAPSLNQIEKTFEGMYQQYNPLVEMMDELMVPLPYHLSLAVEFVNNNRIRQLLKDEKLDFECLEDSIDKIKKWSLNIDYATLSFLATKRINDLVQKLSDRPKDLELLNKIVVLFKQINRLSLDVKCWKAQNIYFQLNKKLYDEISEEADRGDVEAERWKTLFSRLGDYLRVKTS